MRAELSFQQEKTGTKRKIWWSCPYCEISHEDEPWSGELCSWGEDHLILVHLVLSVKPVSKELLSVLVLCSCSLLYAEEHNRFNLSHLRPVLSFMIAGMTCHDHMSTWNTCGSVPGWEHYNSLTFVLALRSSHKAHSLFASKKCCASLLEFWYQRIVIKKKNSKWVKLVS